MKVTTSIAILRKSGLLIARCGSTIRRCSELQSHARFSQRCFSAQPRFVQIAEEVRDAVREKRPVVALETAIYTHGFPYPENIALASRLESLVRINGGVPATVGILDGICRVGMNADELIRLTASAGMTDVRKVSRRDLAYIGGLALKQRRLSGGTTISATALLAEMAGIGIFATGGLGGVHRGWESTMDISADLTELGRTKVVVVSSGCKGFLDVPATLEYLETQGVGVMTFADGREGPVDFPAFWSRESGVRSPFTLKDEKEAAAIAFAQQEMALQSGLLFANPIPTEHSMQRIEVENAISQAVEEAKKVGSIGSENTPFILNRIRQLTDGRTVAANRALVEANVACGTRIALELSKLQTPAALHKNEVPRNEHPAVLSLKPKADPGEVAISPHLTRGEGKKYQVVVAGSVALDLSCDFDTVLDETSSSQPQLHTSNPAIISQSLGGVGANVATALHFLGVPARLCSVVSDDEAGSSVIRLLGDHGIMTSSLRKPDVGSRTAQYVAMNDLNKELFVAAADMEIMQAEVFRNQENDRRVEIMDWMSCKPRWTVVDANWSSTMIDDWLQAARASGSKSAFEPVSVAKARRIFGRVPISRADKSMPVFPKHLIDVTTPNALELRSMFDSARAAGHFDQDNWFNVINGLEISSASARDKFKALTNADLLSQGIPQQSVQLLPFVPCIVTTLGDSGVLITQLLERNDERLTSEAAAPYLLPSPPRMSTVVGGIYMRLFPPPERVPNDEIKSVNGVGDTFLGALVAGLIDSPHRNIEDLIDFAQRCAILTLKSKEAVNPAISVLKST